MSFDPDCCPSREDEVLHERMRNNRPTKDDFFMGLAFIYSRRSHDQHTKHGTFLIDPRNGHPIGAGYNGFLAGLDDDVLPLTRPEKYEHMDHSEPNAVASMTRDAWSIPGGAMAYITGLPCYQCGRTLVRHNVMDWVVAERHGYSNPPANQDAMIEMLVQKRGVKIRRISPDLGWLVDPSFLGELVDLGFINYDFTLQYQIARPGT